jgi:hypothetical protein
LLVATEGFFSNTVFYIIISPGIWVAVVVWRSWCRKIGRGNSPGMEENSGNHDDPPPDPSSTRADRIGVRLKKV